MKLTRSFYERDDVLLIARDLLGKWLCTNIGNHLTIGVITEVEAYRGRNDQACHANNNRRTLRTEVMYGRGGVAYVYLCYGIHHLFNIVTNREGLADAVLIRSIQPISGMDVMVSRRNVKKESPLMSSGPGSMSKSLGITTELYGTDLLGNTIWVEDQGIEVAKSDLMESPRIGVEYAGEDAKLPWRFFLRDNQFVSKRK